MCHSPDGTKVIERWDRLIEILSTEPRRQLIVALNHMSPSKQFQPPETAVSPTGPPDREQITNQVRHRHLPLLEERGYVQWTADSFRARRGSRFDDVAVVFDALRAMAPGIPDRLLHGCQRLENESERGDQ